MASDQLVIDDTHIQVSSRRSIKLTRTGLGYMVGSGDGYHENVSSNNNLNLLSNSRCTGNAGCGASILGFFSPKVEYLQSDYNNFYAVCVGGDGVVLNTSIFGLYCENNGAPGCVRLEYVNGIEIRNAIADHPVLDEFNDAFVVGEISNDQNDDGLSTKPIGSQYFSAVPTTVIKENAYLRGRMFGNGGMGSPVGSGNPGSGFIDFQDSDGVAGRPAGGWMRSGTLNDEHAVAFRMDTSTNYASPGATLREVVERVDKDGNLRLAGSLGVGNSVEAAAIGPMVRKMEVFDAAGNSLGFVAIHAEVPPTGSRSDILHWTKAAGAAALPPDAVSLLLGTEAWVTASRRSNRPSRGLSRPRGGHPWQLPHSEHPPRIALDFPRFRSPGSVAASKKR